MNGGPNDARAYRLSICRPAGARDVLGMCRARNMSRLWRLAFFGGCGAIKICGAASAFTLRAQRQNSPRRVRAVEKLKTAQSVRR